MQSPLILSHICRGRKVFLFFEIIDFLFISIGKNPHKSMDFGKRYLYFL